MKLMSVSGILVCSSFLISVCMFNVVFCTRVAWIYLVCLKLCKEESSSPVSLQLLRGGIWTNFHMCGIMLVLRKVFNMLVLNASPRGPMHFRCLMFSLSGPCALLFLLCFIMDLFVLCI